jgi:hypothetical protein
VPDIQTCEVDVNLTPVEEDHEILYADIAKVKSFFIILMRKNEYGGRLIVKIFVFYVYSS